MTKPTIIEADSSVSVIREVLPSFEPRPKTDGDNPRIAQDQQSLLDLGFGTNASLAPGNANTDREEIGFHLNAVGKYSTFAIRGSRWNDIGLGIGLGGALDPFGAIDNDVIEATYKYERNIVDDFSLGATIDYTYVDYTLGNIHFLPPGVFGVFPDGIILDEEHEETFWKFRVDGRYTGFTAHILSFGAGSELGEISQKSERRNYTTNNGLIIPIGALQDTSSDPILGNQEVSRDLRFIYFQHEWSLYPDWTLTWGVRHDDYNDFGATTNPRAVLVWNARQNLTTKLLYGRSFRAPSLLETKSQHIPAVRSNQDVKPETLNTVELAVDYRPTPRVRTGANIFYHKTDEQIRQQNTGGPDFRPENVGDQIGRGVELELWWEFARNLNFYSYYAYQENEDKTTNEDAGYTPHHKIYVALQKQYHDWFFNVTGTYIGDRDRIAEDTRLEADKYTFIDLLVRYKLSKNFEAGLDIRNIFDEDAEEGGFGTSFPGDMPLPSRNYYFSLTASY
jgi:outer membrane receptor protein involved in Fe transport